MKIFVIGLGFLGSSIVRGLLRSPAPDLRIRTSKRNLAEHDPSIPADMLCGSEENRQRAQQSDVVLACVRSQDWESMAETIEGLGRTGESILVTTAPEVPLSRALDVWGSNHVAKSYPSLPIRVGAGIIPFLGKSQHARDVFRTLFRKVGEPVECKDERELMAVGLYGSSGIALIYRLLLSFQRAFAEAPLPVPERNLFPELLDAALRWHMEGDVDLAAGIEKVATPGGRTIKGLDYLDRAGLDELMAGAYRTMMADYE